MEYIRLTKGNIDEEHICCAVSNNKDIQVCSKKEWLRDRFDEGLVFLKSTVRGKCFIEYIPAENAWVPVIADGYTYIDCLWVAGAMKGHGFSNDLLNECIRDSRENGKKGICILSSQKKRPFLSDPKYLKYKGFSVADESDAGINLMYLPFNADAAVPRFTDAAKHPAVSESGYVLFYTNQCPYNAKYVPLLERAAAENNIPFKSVRIVSREQAKAAPCPCTTYALFHNGRFVTNEELSESKFLQMAKDNG